MNSRGQNLDDVNKSCLINMKYEYAFKKYLEETLNISIDKQHNIYSHYDFTYNDINIIEYKGVYYSLDETNKTAKSNKGGIINNVMIGNDKIKYYNEMKKKNDKLRFYLFYGFYDINPDKQTIIKIVYKYLEITNILNDIINDYNIIDWYNKKHYLIPIKDLLKIDKNIMT
jgi:hypothetical protein